MRAAWWLLGVCVFASGCGLVQRATCNLAYETRRCVDTATLAARHRRWAREAWAHTCAASPEPYSPYFAQGFTDGFLDYVEAGGTGEPPAVPPRRFWTAKFQTYEGRLAIEDWFAGFRQGAAIAREAGYRELAILPSSLSSLASGPPPELNDGPGYPPSPEAERSSAVPGEQLPYPRELRPGEEESEPTAVYPSPGWSAVDVRLFNGCSIRWPVRVQAATP